MLILAMIGCSKEEAQEEEYPFDNAELLFSVWSEDDASSIKDNATISINSFGVCRYKYTLTITSKIIETELDYIYDKPNITFYYQSGTLWGEGYIHENGDGINDKVIDLGEKVTFTCYCFDGVYDFLND